MKCLVCKNGELQSTVVADYQYIECGLPNVFLKNLTVERCASCGCEFPVVPSIAELHRVIAGVLIKKEGRLAPVEIRYLRKYLGWSSNDFAARLHTSVSQVSRWENGRVQMSMPNELLLRSLVALGKKIEDYRVEDAAHGKDPRPRTVSLYCERDAWKEAA